LAQNESIEGGFMPVPGSYTLQQLITESAAAHSTPTLRRIGTSNDAIMVANADGLRALEEAGTITAQQRARILAQLGPQLANDPAHRYVLQFNGTDPDNLANTLVLDRVFSGNLSLNGGNSGYFGIALNRTLNMRGDRSTGEILELPNNEGGWKTFLAFRDTGVVERMEDGRLVDNNKPQPGFMPWGNQDGDRMNHQGGARFFIDEMRRMEREHHISQAYPAQNVPPALRGAVALANNPSYRPPGTSDQTGPGAIPGISGGRILS
jgi:hypothetical protein